MNPADINSILTVVETALRALAIPPSQPSMDTPAATGRAWLSKRAAAEYVGVCPATIERAVKQGRLVQHKVNGGRLNKYHRDDLDRYVRGEMA